MRLAAILFLLLAFPVLCFAQNTWYVPDHYSTIQDAITGSTDGDTIIVRPGTYSENLDYGNKAVTLESELGALVTTINGSQLGSVVVFKSGEGPDSVLEGFTLTNGYGLNGGGVNCTKSSPTIRNNIFSMNETPGSGGGIFCFRSSAVVTNNLFEENRADNHGGGISCDNSTATITGNTFRWNWCAVYGGGIDYYLSHTPITDNHFEENWAGFGGGGIACFQASPLISNNVIRYNYADYPGGGIFCWESSPLITNVIILGNSSGWDGGGIECLVNSSPTVTNTTILNNTAKFRGGGIDCQNSTIDITNTILYNNSAVEYGQEMHLYGDYVYPATVTISYSDVKGGKASVALAADSTLNWNAGMIDQIPLFVDSYNGDLHLTFNSPCKDTGSNAVASLPSHDMEGDPRIAYGTADMGADEFYPHLYVTGYTTAGGDVEIKFVGLPGKLINGLILGGAILDPPLPCDFGLWYMMDPIQIKYGFGSIPASGVAVIPDTIPASSPSPVTVYIQAAIDSWLTNVFAVHIQ